MIRRFDRYELKYLVHESERARLVDSIALQMKPDAHGGMAGYRVSSLYYDSPEFSAYWSKRDGIKYRRKVRIRIYGDASSGPDQIAMLEIKQRINRTVQKRRVSVPIAHAYEMCEGRTPGEFDNPLDRAVAAEVELLAASMRLQPACVVTYLRQAWVGSAQEGHLRITFDQDLGARPGHGRLDPGSKTTAFLPREWLILEVKVDRKVPIWVSRLVTNHNLHLRRVSKYCEALARLAGLERVTPRTGGRGRLSTMPPPGGATMGELTAATPPRRKRTGR